MLVQPQCASGKADNSVILNRTAGERLEYEITSTSTVGGPVFVITDEHGIPLLSQGQCLNGTPCRCTWPDPGSPDPASGSFHTHSLTLHFPFHQQTYRVCVIVKDSAGNVTRTVQDCTYVSTTNKDLAVDQITIKVV